MPSKLFDYATGFFEALNSAATTESVNGKDVRIFRGSIVEIYRSLGVSQSYYSEVRQGLINSGSMSIIQQGARGTESVIVLHRPPEEDSFIAAKDMGLTRQTSDAILTGQLEDLKRLIGNVNIPDALLHFERLITELQNRVTKLEQLLLSKGRT